MDCNMPGFPVHYQLPEPTQTHVHHIGDAIQPSHHLSSPFPHLQSFQASGFQGVFNNIQSENDKASDRYWSFGCLNPLVSLGFFVCVCVCVCVCAFDHTEQHMELPWPGIEPMSPAAEAQSLNHWATKETLNPLAFYFFIANHFQNCFNRKGTGSWWNRDYIWCI